MRSSMVPQADDSDPSVSASRMTVATYIRCLLAVICSHVAAPYAAARLTIRYQLQGDFELRYAMVAGIAVTIGAALSFRQLVNQPSNHKWLLGITGNHFVDRCFVRPTRHCRNIHHSHTHIGNAMGRRFFLDCLEHLDLQLLPVNGGSCWSRFGGAVGCSILEFGGSNRPQRKRSS